MDLWEYEKDLYKKGICYIGGVDEAGRGPLVGNVVAACCVLPKDFVCEGLTDSKKLTEKKRDIFYDYIVHHAIAYGIGEVTPKEIDEINIYEASRMAMLDAISKLSVKPDFIITDAMPLNKENSMPTNSKIINSTLLSTHREPPEKRV